MRYLTVKSLPKIRFAHTFGIDSYENEFKPSRDIIEITYLAKGSLRYISTHEDFVLKQGGICINTYSYPLRVETNEYHEHHTVSFHVQYDLSDTPGALSVPTLIAAPADRAVKLLDEIIRTHTFYADSDLRSAGLCLQLLYELSVAAASRGGSLYVKKVENYIFQHIHEPIRQGDIARALGITPEYLCAVFKKYENTTVMSYVNRVKLDSIRSVMEKEHLPLYKAAELYGYADPNYVSRLYKKMFHANITDNVKKT